MFDEEIISIIRAHENVQPREPYTCQNPNCGEVTYGPPGLTHILCDHCREQTEVGRRAWCDAVEITAENKPAEPKPLLPISRPDLLVMLLSLIVLVLS